MSSTTTLPLDELKAVCARFGLEIIAAHRHGVMLTLVPHNLEHIPDAQALREIADALGGDGIRYVTLDLDPPQ